MFKKIAEYYNLAKAIFAIKGKVKNMKITELSTSEGRLAVLLNIISLYAAVKGFLPADLAAKIAAGSIVVYTVARAIVKAAEAIAKLTPTLKDDKIVEEAGKLLDAAGPKAQ